jgi:hypothetical protein
MSISPIFVEMLKTSSLNPKRLTRPLVRKLHPYVYGEQPVL